MTSYYPPSSYKAPVRQEGFHLPSPAPSNGNNPPSPTQNFDINNQLFLPQLLSDPFRKFNSDGPAAPSMDFSDELASLIAHSPAPHTNHQSSHERSTQSPVSASSANGYEDNYRPPTTHNIFDISAPTTNHSHQQQQSNPNGYQNQFPLPPNSQGSHQPASYHGTIHEYNPHSHFNSTLPALNSTMRYDPQPSASHDQPFSSHFSPPSDYPQVRHSPSPVGFGSSTSRSRSRSRAPPTSAHANEPPSTNGGPARTVRHKRNSISSTSPPPPHRTQAIVIPTHRPPSQHTPTSATSPLSLHSISSSTTSGWFIPNQQQQHEFRHNEFNLPTPDSVNNHHGFSQFNPNSVGSLGVSPKDVSVGKGVSAVESEDDAVSKQAMLAVEKRRRRRESHNAVERRRRDNINERIAELATLIPESMLDPNAPVTSRSGDEFLFGITGISGLSNPLGSEGLISMKKDDDDNDELGELAATKKSGGTNGTHTEGGIVKANKGMILRKSVEYIKYLQQLVSAQGSRNRDLDQELAAYRQEHTKDSNNDINAPEGKDQHFGPGADGEAEDMSGLVLHEEDFGRDMNGINEYSKAYIRGLELGGMPEQDQDMDADRRRVERSGNDADNQDDPLSASGMETLTSPSAGSGSIDGEDDRSEPGAELNRGRDRTVRTQAKDEQVKVKSETEDMET